MKALLVEPSPLGRRVLSLALNEAGIEVVVPATTLSEAAAILDEQGGELSLIVTEWDVPWGTDDPPSAVEADGANPLRTGLDLVARVRGAEATRAVPVLLVTRRHDAAEVEAAREAGAGAYLRKPVSREAVVDRVRRLLRAASGTAEPAAASNPEAATETAGDGDAPAGGEERAAA